MHPRGLETFCRNTLRSYRNFVKSGRYTWAEAVGRCDPYGNLTAEERAEAVRVLGRMADGKSPSVFDPDVPTRERWDSPRARKHVGDESPGDENARRVRED